MPVRRLTGCNIVLFRVLLDRDVPLVEESINDSVSVDLGTCNTGAIGNNDLVVAVQR